MTTDAEYTERALALIDTARYRQVHVHGRVPEHDAKHTNGELAASAACYAARCVKNITQVELSEVVMMLWPWDNVDDKALFSTRRLKHLSTAAALLTAEIERELRAIDAATVTNGPDPRIAAHDVGAIRRAIARLEIEKRKLVEAGDYDAMFPEADIESLKAVYEVIEGKHYEATD